MLYLLSDINDPLAKLLSDDPVRPHIDSDLRIGYNRDVFVLEDRGTVLAMTCVSYHYLVPQGEEDLFSDHQPTVAVFYTIWSYASGAGRMLLQDAMAHIKNNRRNIDRFVTLSPKTEMAHRFHINNGAIVFRENPQTINYEYLA